VPFRKLRTSLSMSRVLAQPAIAAKHTSKQIRKTKRIDAYLTLSC